MINKTPDRFGWLGTVDEKSDVDLLREIRSHNRKKGLHFYAYKFVKRENCGSPYYYCQRDNLFYLQNTTLELPREQCDKNTNHDCGAGINVASNWWAIRSSFGMGASVNRDRFKIIELKIDLCDIVCIPKDHEGKFRVCKVFVIGREL